MPTKKKVLIVKKVLEGKHSVTSIASEAGIARKTIYAWVKIYKNASSRNKKTCLSAKYIKGRVHPKEYRHTLEQKIIRLIKKDPTLSVSKMAKKLNAGHHAVYNLLTSLKLSTGDSRLAYSRIYSFPGIFDPQIKESVVRKVINSEGKVSDISRELRVARKTIYKWLKEYKESGKVKNNYLSGFDHPRALGPEVETAVLSKVAAVPELSIHKLAEHLSYSNHAVFNILKRNFLTQKTARIAYSQAQNAQAAGKAEPAGFIERTKSVFETFTPNLAPAPPPAKSKTLSLFLVSTLFITVSLVFFYWMSIVVGASSFGASVGMVFAGIALAFGMFFFLYSLKYFISMAIVLSYSQREGLDNSKGTAIGLKSDLTGVQLKRHPLVSVHLALYNEKNVVERLLKAATSFDYDNYEVIIADDSTDETSDKIRQYMNDFVNKGRALKKTSGDGWVMTEVEVKGGVVFKHVHRTARTGYKGGALGLALTLTDPKAEFVSVFDADFVPYPDSLTLFLKYFKLQNNGSENYSTSNTASVQGYQWHVLNKSENWITRGVRSEYAGSYVIERAGTEIYRGLKQISGSVYMVRRDVLQSIGWGTSITEDFELTLKLYEKGYKVVYTPYIQAPAECVSTVRRLIRQRMRWAEGHSFNIKKMFAKLMFSPKLSFAEKFETAYLAPYYLQAFFFLVGTFSWLLSEAVFKVRLPFWTDLWGWSLVLTNLISLPLLNSVGLFLEESDQKDYIGTLSFIAMSYLVVPFQAYAAVKGFLENEEGPWFRTPKTGRITDVFKRGRFYKFISDILPGKVAGPAYSNIVSPYLALSSANNQFNNFSIKIVKGRKWVGKAFLASLLIISNLVMSLAPSIPYFIKPAEVHAQSFDTINGSKAAAPINNFQNGVLVLNTNKLAYVPGENALLQIGVLDKNGDTQCNADITLNVYSPDGKIDKYSEKDQTIKKSNTCRADNNVTDKPDYIVNYKVGRAGTYRYDLTNNSNRYQINGSFEVKGSLSFVVERVSATRINPSKAEYGTTIKITANQEYKGEVTEEVPSDFSVTKHTGAVIRFSNSSQELVWNANLKVGQTETYQYTYKAPERSPDIFTLGPLNVSDQNLGRWQIASDTLRVSNGTGGGNSGTGASWVGGVAPVTGDTIQIVGGDTITQSGAVVSYGGIQVDSNGIFALGSTGITDTGTGTGTNGFTLNGSITGTGTILLNGVGCTIDGTGSPSSTGLVTLTGNKTFAATANLSFASALTVSTGSTITITAGAVITVAGVTTVTSTGTVTNNGTFTASSTFTGTGGWTQAASSVLYLRGSGTNANAITTFTATVSNTVYYDLNGAQTCKVVQYYNIVLGGGGTKTCALTSTVLGYMSVISGASALTQWNVSTSFTITGNLTVTGSASYIAALSIAGVTTTVSGNLSISYGRLIRSSGTCTLTVSTGTFDVPVSSTAEVQQVAINIGGATTIEGTLTFTTSATGAATFSGTTHVYNGGTITASGFAKTYTFTGDVTVDSGGVFDLKTAGNLASVTTFGGNIIANGTTFNSGTGAVTLSGTADRSISGSCAVFLGGTLTIPTDVVLTNSSTNAVTGVTFGNLTIASGAAANGLTLADGTITNTTALLTFSANGNNVDQVITLQGNADLNVGTNLVMNNVPTNSGSGKIVCDGTGTSANVNVTGTTGIRTAGTAVNGRNVVDLSACSAPLFSSAGLITITGNATVGVTAAELKVGANGTITAGNGITTATNAATSLITTASTSVINLKGALTIVGQASLTNIDPGTNLRTGVGGVASIASAITWPGKLEAYANTTSMGAADIITGALTVDSGAILRVAGFAFTAGSTTDIFGSINCPAAATCTGLKTFTGVVTVESGGAFDLLTGAPSVVPSLSFGNNITMNSGASTFNTNTGATAFTASTTLTSATAMTFGATTINNGATLTNNTSNSAVVTFFSLTMATGAAANYLNLYTGTISNVTGALAFTANTNTVNQTITLYGNADLNVGGALTMTGVPTSSGISQIVCDASTGSTAHVDVTGTTGIVNASTGVNGRNVVDLSACSQPTFSSIGTITITGSAGGNTSAELRVGNNGTITAGNGITTATTAAKALISTGSPSTINLKGALTIVGQASLTNITASTNLITGVGGAASIASAITWPGTLEVYANTTTIAGIAVTISGTTTIDSGATLTLSSATGAKIFTGDVTVNGIWNETAAAIPTFAGNLINNATTWTPLAGIHTFSGTNKTISGTQITTIPNITVTGSVTNIGTVTCSTTLIGAGTFTNGDGSTGTLNYGGVGGASFNVTNFYASATGNTVNYTNTGANVIIRAPSGAGSHYYNLTIATTGRFASLAAAISVDHDLNISSGSLSDAGFQITGNGTGTLTIGSGAYLCVGAATASCTTSSPNVISFPTNFVNFSLDPASFVVYLSSGAAQPISNAPTYGNLSIIPVLTGPISKTFGGPTNINGDFTIDPSRSSNTLLTVNMAGDIVVDSAHTTTIDGSGTGPARAKLVTTSSDYNLTTGKLNITAYGTLDCTGSTSTIELTGTSGPLLANAGSFTAGSSTVLATGAAGAVTLLSGNTTTFYNLTVNNAASVWGLSADAVINSTLTVAAGTLAMGSQNVTVGSTGVSGSGDVVINGATSQSASGTFTVESSSGGTAQFTGSGELDVYNLTLGDGVTTFTIDNETGDVVIDVAASFNITTGATYQASSTADLKVAGDWTKSGNFTANNGTVTLDGAGSTTQIITGTTGFHSLYATASTSRTLQFAASTTFTVTGDLTLTGNSCTDPLILRSSSTNTQFNLADTSGGTTTVNYIDVGDSNASSQAIVAANGTNSGDNSNWTITTICTVTSTSAAATGYSFQRKTWYDGTYYWKSFYTGSQIQFWYSSDVGASWIQNLSAALTVSSSDFSIDADSSNCFIVYTVSNDIRGQKASSYPNINFGWSGEVIILNGSGATDDYSYPVIMRDSSSYVWVGARYTGSGVYYFRTIKEITSANTLPEDSGDTVYSLSDNTNSNSNVFGTLVSTGSQNMYATFVSNTSLEGCKWVNGSAAWQDSSSPANSCTSGTGGSWYDPSWSYRNKITIDNTKVDADLTDYPVYIDLSNMPASFFSHANQTDCRDIRVTKADGTTELPREIVSCSPSGKTGELYVKYSGTLPSATDTDIYIYYGNSGASDYAVTDTYGARNVWSNYVSVWHFKEGSGTTIADSKGGHTATLQSSGSNWTTSGAIGYGYNFNSGTTGDYALISDNADYHISSYTNEAWIKPNSPNVWAQVFTNGGSSSAWQFGVGISSDDFAMDYGTGSDWHSLNSIHGMPNSELHMYAASINVPNPTNRQQILYRDGSSIASQSIYSADPNTYQTGVGEAIGDDTNGGNRFNGTVDELRMSSVVRSPEWIMTEYKNQSSPSTFFNSWGTEETPGGGSSDPIASVTSGVSAGISSVSDSSGNVHLLYIDSSGYTSYQEYTGSWQAVVTLDGTSGNIYPTISLDSATSDLYALWVRSNHIYYKEYTNSNSTWDTNATDWHSDTSISYLTSNYSADGRIFAEWTSSASAPYTVNWDIIAVPENLWLFFSLGIVVPFYARKKRKVNSAVITRQY